MSALITPTTPDAAFCTVEVTSAMPIPPWFGFLVNVVTQCNNINCEKLVKVENIILSFLRLINSSTKFTKNVVINNIYIYKLLSICKTWDKTLV